MQHEVDGFIGRRNFKMIHTFKNKYFNNSLNISRPSAGRACRPRVPNLIDTKIFKIFNLFLFVVDMEKSYEFVKFFHNFQLSYLWRPKIIPHLKFESSHSIIWFHFYFASWSSLMWEKLLLKPTFAITISTLIYYRQLESSPLIHNGDGLN